MVYLFDFDCVLFFLIDFFCYFELFYLFFHIRNIILCDKIIKYMNIL